MQLPMTLPALWQVTPEAPPEAPENSDSLGRAPLTDYSLGREPLEEVRRLDSTDDVV